MPNQGYLSEAAASLVDTKLGLGVVPKTKVGPGEHAYYCILKFTQLQRVVRLYLNLMGFVSLLSHLVNT